MQTETAFHRQLQGYRMTTAEILYHLPDHPAVLQTYVWQDLDLAPRFPVLGRFLKFWEREIEGRLHSVRVASAEMSRDPAFRDVEFREADFSAGDWRRPARPH